MPITIKTNKMMVKGDNGYTTLDTVSDSTTSSKVAEIESVASAQKTQINTLTEQKKQEITAKGEETKTSIPEDYTALSNEVGELKEDIAVLYSENENVDSKLGLVNAANTNNISFTAVDGNASGNIGDVVTLGSQSWFKRTSISVSAGETYRLNVLSAENAAIVGYWYVLDDNNVIVQKDTTVSAVTKKLTLDVHISERGKKLVAFTAGNVTNLRINHINYFSVQSQLDEKVPNEFVRIDDSDFVESGFVNTAGQLITNDAWMRTDYIDLCPGGIFVPMIYHGYAMNVAAVAIYAEDKTLLGAIKITDSTNLVSVDKIFKLTDFTVGEKTARYARFCTCILGSAPDSAYIRYVKAIGTIVNTKGDDDGENPEYRKAYSDANRITGYVPGYIGTNGQLLDTGTTGLMYRSNPIDLDGLSVIYLKGNCNYWTFFGFFDENNRYLGGKEYLSAKARGNEANRIVWWNLKPEARYLIVSFASEADAQTCWATATGMPPTDDVVYTSDREHRDYAAYPANPCDYNGDEICVFNRCLCIGDSLTEGTMNAVKDAGTDEYINMPKYSYPTILSKITGIEVVNKGHGGKTSEEWFAMESDSDLSGFDVAIIQLGVNDAVASSGWGGWSEAHSKPAFLNIINKIKAENKNIKIFVSTVMPAYYYKGEAIDSVSAGIRALVAELNDPNVILLDMARYAHTGETMAYNCGHLSALGYYRLARDYKSYISYKIMSDKMLYREVQFIGTDLYYGR